MSGEPLWAGTWGYTDRFSARPGESLQLMMSSPAERVSLSIVRLGRIAPADGLHLAEKVDVAPAIAVAGGTYPLSPGSYVSVGLAASGSIECNRGLTLCAWICPSVAAESTVATRWILGARDAVGPVAIGHGSDGAVLAIGDATVAAGEELTPGEWYFVAGTLDAATGLATLRQVPAREWPGRERWRASAAVPRVPSRLVEELRIGGVPPGPGGSAQAVFFNGKIDEPALFDRALDEVELDALVAGADAAGMVGVAGAWGFLPARPSGLVTDRSPAGRHGRAVNLPTTAVPGHRWRGEAVGWRAAPAQYSAIALHDDDLEDAGWPVVAEQAIPDGLPSGVYAFQLSGSGGGGDEVPFFVRPGARRNDVLFLAPTFTYLAYANEHWTWCNPAVELSFDASSWLSEADRYAADHRLLSLYDHHSDDSGVCFASRRRPLVSVRPDYLGPCVRGRRELSADLLLTDWLEATGTGYDVATDDDLHAEGSAMLEGYRVVITGSHPEYCSAAMLDALEAYLSRGGRLMYLGGNGFYWVTTVDPDRDHVIEVRRGHAGSGTWRSAPGEVDHSHTGEPGGLWRHRGRAPQRLVGVGMSAIGLGPGRAYRRQPESEHPAVSWIFDGVGDEPIGEHGQVLGAAAGLEIDRADAALGTPRNAVVLASASGFDDSYQGVVEEVLESNSRQGGTVCPSVRADMTYFETPKGGAVFSVGSITWSGALAHNGRDNPASRITANVLGAFCEDRLPRAEAGRRADGHGREPLGAATRLPSDGARYEAAAAEGGAR